MASPFIWEGNTGSIRTPGGARDARATAAALAAGRQKVASNGWEGLSQIANALSERAWRDEATAAEEAGAAQAAEAIAGITPESDFSSIASALANPWLSDSQATVASALLQQNLQRNDPLRQAQIAKLNAELAAGPGSNETFFGNIVPMQDEAGNVILGQASNQGRWQPLQGAEGFRPAPTTKQLDTGTEIITTDIYGNEISRTPKALREAAAETAGGTVQGRTAAESAALADSIESKMPGLEYVVGELRELANVATYTKSGQVIDAIMREAGQEPTEAAVARQKYISMVDNQILPLLRDTFGAQFTQKEGETLRATLGNPDLSPLEKQAVLDSFINQKRRDLAGMRGQPVPNSSSTEVIDWMDL